MPIHYDNPIKCYLDENGEWREFPSEIKTFTMEASENCNFEYISGINKSGGEITTTCRLRAQRISRKRFINELLDLDFTGKEAKILAKCVKRNYANYLFAIRLVGREYAKILTGGRVC